MIKCNRIIRHDITFDAPILSLARYDPIITPYIMISMHIFHPRTGLTPALFTKIWTLPLNACSVWDQMDSQSASFDTSHLKINYIPFILWEFWSKSTIRILCVIVSKLRESKITWEMWHYHHHIVHQVHSLCPLLLFHLRQRYKPLHLFQVV